MDAPYFEYLPDKSHLQGVRWRYHMPFFLNTFVFGYHLARTIEAICAPDSARKAIDWHVKHHHNWPQLPIFDFSSDIDIIIGTDDTACDLERGGHGSCNSGFLKVPITKYAPDRVYTREIEVSGEVWDAGAIQSAITAPLTIVTDSTKAADPFCNDLKRRNAQIAELRLSNSRSLGELFCVSGPRLFVFGAPKAEVMGRDERRYKRLLLSADQKTKLATQTWAYIRYNRGVEDIARIFEVSITKYFRELLLAAASRAESEAWFDDRLPNLYDRMARTHGDVALFFGCDAESSRNLVCEMLARHHVGDGL